MVINIVSYIIGNTYFKALDLRRLAAGCGYVERGQDVRITLDCGTPVAGVRFEQ